MLSSPEGSLARAIEFLPDEAELDARAAEGVGLSTPESAVLLAYSKISLSDHLIDSGIADEPWFARALQGYFPVVIRERFGDRLDDHPLRRQIIVTCVVNDLVNRGGITFVFRAEEETGASAAEVSRAYTAVREIFGLESFWEAIAALDGQVPTAVQSVLYFEARRLLDRGVRWFLQSRRSRLDVAAEISRFAPAVRDLAGSIPDYLLGVESQRLLSRAEQLQEEGVPPELSLRAAGLLDAFSLLDVVQIADSAGLPADQVAPLYFAVSERMQVDRLLLLITALPRGDRWQSLARSALRYDLYSALAALTMDVLLTAKGSADHTPEDLIDAWAADNADGLARARATLDEVTAVDSPDLATLSVALRVVRTLLRTGAGGDASSAR